MLPRSPQSIQLTELITRLQSISDDLILYSQENEINESRESLSRHRYFAPRSLPPTSSDATSLSMTFPLLLVVDVYYFSHFEPTYIFLVLAVGLRWLQPCKEFWVTEMVSTKPMAPTTVPMVTLSMEPMDPRLALRVSSTSTYW